VTLFRKRRWLWVIIPLLCLVVVGVAAARWGLLGRIGFAEGGELGDIKSEWVRAVDSRSDARNAAKTAGERQAADDEFAARERELVEHCRDYARSHAGKPGELTALKLVACHVPKSPAGKEALQTLASACETADLDRLTSGLKFQPGASEEPIQSLAGILLKRVRQSPDDPEAPVLLASVICPLAITSPLSSTPPTDFRAAADLLVERYADRPGIQNFCEIIGLKVARAPWAAQFERHLRAILAKNHDRQVLVSGSFALATLVQAAGESRQLEAQRLYRDFVDRYDGTVRYTEDGKWYPYAGVEQQLNQAARKQLTELSERGLGKPAPEIAGVDLDGAPLKLSDFRGKVVLLSFWATSCGPCLKFVPAERALLAGFEPKSFTIVGINCDEDPQLGQRTAREHGITWRCFRDQLGKGRTISGDWQNVALPMMYLIDPRGRIKRRWVGAPLREELHDAVAKLGGVAIQQTR
jgi:peroxiredoxin